MTKMQELLGKILKNRIESELVKEKSEQNFATIKETMDIFLAGDKIAADQYEEFTNLIKSSDNKTDNSETKIS